MNLKEKWSKQNNSIKLLLKKLKRHDTLVVGIAVVIATALCGGLIYLSTPVVTATAREELMQDEMANNEKTVEKLDELKAYLNGIDKTVAENQKSLSIYSEKTSENHKEAGELTERMTSSVTEKVVGLDKDMQELRNLINNTETSIEVLKQSLEKSGSDNRSKVEKEITNLYVELEKIENKYSETQENTKNLMAEIQTAVKNGNKGLSKEMQDQYNELLSRLVRTDEKLTEQNTSTMADFKAELGSISNTINNHFAKMDSTINSGMDNVNNGIAGVSNDIAGVSNDIAGVNSGIAGVSNDIAGVSNDIAGVSKGIAGVNSGIAGVSNDIAGVSKGIAGVSSGIAGVSNDIAGVNSGIAGVSNDIAGVNSGIAGVSNDIAGVSKGIAGVSSGIAGVSNSITGVSNGIVGVNNEIVNVNSEISVVKGDLAGLKSYIGGEIRDVNKQLEQVFTYVSDGKKLVASALLTKGIKVREDATFAEIAKGIMEFKTEYTLPGGEIPGEVEYTYHYHTDATGAECDDELVGEDRKGGCYTNEVHHVHSKDCYETEIVYYYDTNKDVVMVSYEGDYYTGEAFYKFHCNFCGKTYVSTGSGHVEKTTSLNQVKNRNGVLKKSEEKKTKICAYEDDELEGYATSCGFIHGQVVGAKLKFKGNGVDYETVTENGKGGSSEAGNSALMTTFIADDPNMDGNIVDTIIPDGSPDSSDAGMAGEGKKTSARGKAEVSGNMTEADRDEATDKTEEGKESSASDNIPDKAAGNSDMANSYPEHADAARNDKGSSNEKSQADAEMNVRDQESLGATE
ncbi:MAG: hypothetical protein E7307_05235 [Butyrivibrio sp.]|nr:hypothetical protein [Butyrivibrio sp.]